MRLAGEGQESLFTRKIIKQLSRIYEKRRENRKLLCRRHKGANKRVNRKERKSTALTQKPWRPENKDQRMDSKKALSVHPSLERGAITFVSYFVCTFAKCVCVLWMLLFVDLHRLCAKERKAAGKGERIILRL